MLPIIWQAGTYGPTASITSGGTGAMFKAVGTMDPSRPAATYSAVCTPARSCASCVDAAICGVRMALSNSRRGLSVQGSLSCTSMPTAPILPAARKSASDFSSKMPPRAAFTRITPSFIRAYWSGPNIPMVSFVLGRWTVMKSANGTRASTSSYSVTPSCSARSGLQYGS